MTNPIIIKVEDERWQQAQQFELQFAQDAVNQGDDYNHWWFDAFEGYKELRGRSFPNVLEVGCGPNTNLRLILPLIKFNRVWLEDPLIHTYIGLRMVKRLFKIVNYSKPVHAAALHKKFQATLLPEPVEELSLPDHHIDLCVCINVLDHVYNAELCMKQMQRVLGKEGILVLAQDLSNDEDMQLCPESWTDIGHPIKIDDLFLDAQLAGFTPIRKTILPREQGRNPRCHYGTYLFVGQKF